LRKTLLFLILREDGFDSSRTFAFRSRWPFGSFGAHGRIFRSILFRDTLGAARGIAALIGTVGISIGIVGFGEEGGLDPVVKIDLGGDVRNDAAHGIYKRPEDVDLLRVKAGGEGLGHRRSRAVPAPYG